ncbi:hypothetical protein CVT26_002463 [Gymnopilus dilepis]|uniref:Uncharacterized protein n=1 Tax=Gymnopilus dilepis TaxID=231916 RepID=A0A409Y3R7_9AGAR|nr:hypothetical protein CVT26_002463 [Gymnopilus dilepis]
MKILENSSGWIGLGFEIRLYGWHSLGCNCGKEVLNGASGGLRPLSGFQVAIHLLTKPSSHFFASKSRQMSTPRKVIYNDAATMTESTTPLIKTWENGHEKEYRDACINTDLLGTNGGSNVSDRDVLDLGVMDDYPCVRREFVSISGGFFRNILFKVKNLFISGGEFTMVVHEDRIYELETEMYDLRARMDRLQAELRRAKQEKGRLMSIIRKRRSI